MDEYKLSLFFNEDQEIGREVRMFCVEANSETNNETVDKSNEEKGYEMKEVFGELANIERITGTSDVKEAYWQVPVPKASNWYIDTDDEDSEDDEPPRVIKRRKIMVKSKSEEDTKAKETESNDEKEMKILG